MKRNSNYQDFIKLIAIIAMLIDHIGLYFFPDALILRFIGRIAMPIFCFFAGYNYRGRIRYDVLIYGSILYAITTVICNEFVVMNILISIFIGYVYLYFFYNEVKTFNKGYTHVVVLSCLWYFSENFIDYGTLGIAIMVLGVMAKHDINNLKLSIFIAQVLSLLHTFSVFEPRGLEIVLIVAFGISNYFLMTIQNFKAQINFNLLPITRNTLFIFFIQSSLIEVIWFIAIGSH